MPVALAALCLALVAVTIVAEERGGGVVAQAVPKGTASACFIAVGAQVGDPASPAYAPMLAALALGLVGDVLLVGASRGPFLAGLVAFLLSHIAWAAAFVQRGVSPPSTALAVVMILPVALGVWRWLREPVAKKRMTGAVLAYIAVISGMVACAAGTVAEVGGPLVLVGAVLFFLSDLTVARRRFVVSDVWNRRIGLPLYYVAQLVLAATTC